MTTALLARIEQLLVDIRAETGLGAQPNSTLRPVQCPRCGCTGPFNDYRITTVPPKPRRECQECGWEDHPSTFHSAPIARCRALYSVLREEGPGPEPHGLAGLEKAMEQHSQRERLKEIWAEISQKERSRFVDWAKSYPRGDVG